MKNSSMLKAALLGVAVLFGPSAELALAENIQVIRKGASRDLSIPMNRAVVIESDVPFAELSIANPSIADFSTLSDRTVYVLGKAPGRTTLTLLDATGRLITNVEVHVSPDISEFKERLQQILPGEKIEVRSANDGIVLSGTVTSASKMDRALELAQRYAPERVSNLLSVSGKQQVMLKVRFAEMQRSVSKALGTSLGIDGRSNNSVGTIGGTNTTNTQSGVLGLLGGAIPDVQNNNGALGIGFDLGSVEVGILLEALETKGMVRTLAEPNLTALSGQEAKFLAGGEYPIPVAQDNGTTAIEFKPFGVELNFVPRVLDDEAINLEMAAAVSSIDPSNGITTNGFTVDAFRRRDTSTTVVLRDGQSFAIAGLLQDDFRDNAGQVPWLGDMPVLGALFRSADYERSQTELVIIVSAHLVTPTSGDAYVLPTDRVKLPTEKDLFLNGRVAKDVRESGSAGEVAQQDFNGSYGYVMD
ncbi:type II and III secretion system protein family protein [Roseovarius aestuariivivens]|uniref:type II and III secretion system protein family protein n=1 Tax=Roseovarius aestuariivivens TaxID=1888910 RepID=UPI001080BE58|nr:type II and III secretion system protein family protein [Roseovarius aestuariivivens]